MKRFTDTSIWNKPWFRKLSPAEKAAWEFIKATCDNVGVWDGDTEAAEFYVGEPVDWDSLPSKTNGNIEILECGKWWLCDFIRFQHQDLFADYKSKSPSNACKSYVLLLQNHGLYERFPELFKAFGKPSGSLGQGYKEQELLCKGKGKGKDLEQELEPVVVNEMEKWEPESVGDRTYRTFEQEYGSLVPRPHREMAAVNQLIGEARARGDPEAILPGMIATLKRLKDEDNSKRGFWRKQPFLPSTLVSLWAQVWEEAKQEAEDDIDDEEVVF